MQSKNNEDTTRIFFINDDDQDVISDLENTADDISAFSDNIPSKNNTIINNAEIVDLKHKEIHRSDVQNITGSRIRISVSSILMLLTFLTLVTLILLFNGRINKLNRLVASLTETSHELALRNDNQIEALSNQKGTINNLLKYSLSYNIYSDILKQNHDIYTASVYTRSSVDTASLPSINISGESTLSRIRLKNLVQELTSVKKEMQSDFNIYGIDVSNILTDAQQLINTRLTFFPDRWPTDSGRISSEWGYRTDPFTGITKYHSGLDIAVNYGVNIYAAASGTVIYAGYKSGYGNHIIIDHGYGISTLYGHASALTAEYGEHVTKGEIIAYVGSTGRSTGPHLHFEVRENGDYVNPLGYVSMP